MDDYLLEFLRDNPFEKAVDEFNAHVAKAVETGEPQWAGVWGPTQQKIWVYVGDEPE